MTHLPTTTTTTLTLSDDLGTIGQAANIIAARHIFDEYRQGKAKNTTRRHDADLAVFADFLATTGAVITGDLAMDPSAWVGMTWGIVEAFKGWMLGEGYSIASVNARLSTVKTYAALAAKAGAIDDAEARLIASVSGYAHKQGRNIDQARVEALRPTRIGHKKAEWVTLDKEQAEQLKRQPDTPQGRRDALLMCLLLNHGLRCGEVARLKVGDINLKKGELVFYRPKVDLIQRHKLTADTLAAARSYLASDGPALGPLFRGSNKAGKLTTEGISEQAITARVKTLGEALGIDHLSAHDCRHYWATSALAGGTQLDRLQDAGGWSSPAMPLRYASRAKVANEGVKLD